MAGNVQVFPVNATPVNRVPGRKTAKAAAQGLARLMRSGLLQASFIPPQGQRDVRDLTRYRTKLVQERTREVNRGQGVLAHWEYANSFRGTTFVDVIALAKRSFDGAMTALNQSGDLP